ncbi:NAD(P)/FAD-dependent oxidoreductase [Cupriavidus sp. UYPR2.512]|uniref:NAD(P)/FAD-dependent oxidoreductase n=1 Tax=Cupriavidus sp. UYPR2.512 TaxID=1080187 RepID=UPI0003634F44|nr:FAD-dependent oxidoreductase [Cupriavidus sp. UYPR2.512]UIF88084.1 tryptophan 7-halogenase [Cupriavidus necator]UIF88093.1 tryptophan 7-halogenase [Cupriavidus necator]
MPQRYDVAIAGGGPAGSAAAIALARSGLRVLIADAQKHPGAGETSSFRIGEGLPPSARHLLRELGVLERVLDGGHRLSHGTVAFWGAAAPHFNDFMLQLHGPGLQLDRPRFDASLRDASRAAGAELTESAQLRIDTAAASAHEPHVLSLSAHDGDMRTLTARWIVDATGRAASLARSLGASPIRYDSLLAFYLRLRTDARSDRDGRTWVEAVEDGWWYSVLLPSGERLIAFLCDGAITQHRALLDTHSLWAALAHAPNLHALCAEHGYRPSGRPRGADASSVALNATAGTHWLAAGDAALAFDPLSSKGISSALHTGLQAARAIVAVDAGDASAIGRYAAHLHDLHCTYRDQLASFYVMETRWSDAAFWKTRRR